MFNDFGTKQTNLQLREIVNKRRHTLNIPYVDNPLSYPKTMLHEQILDKCFGSICVSLFSNSSRISVQCPKANQC